MASRIRIPHNRKRGSAIRRRSRGRFDAFPGGKGLGRWIGRPAKRGPGRKGSGRGGGWSTWRIGRA